MPISSRRSALRKAREIVAEHVARYGEFTAAEVAEGQAAWSPPEHCPRKMQQPGGFGGFGPASRSRF
jgi:hypothetical protein